VNPVSRRQEVENSCALSGTDRLAEGNRGGEGSVSARSASSEGGNLRDALTDHAGGGLSPSEHRGGLEPRIGERESSFPGDSARLAGGDGNVSDPLRGDRLVSETRNATAAGLADRSGQDADDAAAQLPNAQASRKQRRGNSALTANSSLLFPKQWQGAQGLAEDVRYYGQWMRDEAEKRIGHLYPKIGAWFEPRTGRYFGDAEVARWKEIANSGQEIGKEDELSKAMNDCGYDSISSLLSSISYRQLTVIAWLWARTVKSEDPAFPQSRRATGFNLYALDQARQGGLRRAGHRGRRLSASR
jgi:putative DNA methylase